MSNIFGLIATAVAVLGVVMNNRRRRACFLLWLVSNVVTGIIHGYAGLWGLLLRDVIFTALAIEGWFIWGRNE